MKIIFFTKMWEVLKNYLNNFDDFFTFESKNILVINYGNKFTADIFRLDKLVECWPIIKTGESEKFYSKLRITIFF